MSGKMQGPGADETGSDAERAALEEWATSEEGFAGGAVPLAVPPAAETPSAREARLRSLPRLLAQHLVEGEGYILLVTRRSATQGTFETVYSSTLQTALAVDVLRNAAEKVEGHSPGIQS